MTVKLYQPGTVLPSLPPATPVPVDTPSTFVLLPFSKSSPYPTPKTHRLPNYTVPFVPTGPYFLGQIPQNFIRYDLYSPRLRSVSPPDLSFPVSVLDDNTGLLFTLTTFSPWDVFRDDTRSLRPVQDLPESTRSRDGDGRGSGPWVRQRTPRNENGSTPS